MTKSIDGMTKAELIEELNAWHGDLNFQKLENQVRWLPSQFYNQAWMKKLFRALQELSVLDTEDVNYLTACIQDGRLVSDGEVEGYSPAVLYSSVKKILETLRQLGLHPTNDLVTEEGKIAQICPATNGTLAEALKLELTEASQATKKHKDRHFDNQILKQAKRLGKAKTLEILKEAK